MKFWLCIKHICIDATLVIDNVDKYRKLFCSKWYIARSTQDTQICQILRILSISSNEYNFISPPVFWRDVRRCPMSWHPNPSLPRKQTRTVSPSVPPLPVECAPSYFQLQWSCDSSFLTGNRNSLQFTGQILFPIMNSLLLWLLQ